jgi:large subunit ribosomal protein L31e
MAELKRSYVIPLRQGWQKAPKYRRAKRAVTEVKNFVTRHMKSENVKIGRRLNMLIWERGIKSPPHKVKVDVTKKEDVVMVELTGHVFEEPLKAEVVGDKGMLAQAMDTVKGVGKKEEPATKKEKKQSDKKSEEKKEKIIEKAEKTVKKDSSKKSADKTIEADKPLINEKAVEKKVNKNDNKTKVEKTIKSDNDDQKDSTESLKANTPKSSNQETASDKIEISNESKNLEK